MASFEIPDRLVNEVSKQNLSSLTMKRKPMRSRYSSKEKLRSLSRQLKEDILFFGLEDPPEVISKVTPSPAKSLRKKKKTRYVTNATVCGVYYIDEKSTSSWHTIIFVIKFEHNFFSPIAVDSNTIVKSGSLSDCGAAFSPSKDTNQVPVFLVLAQKRGTSEFFA